MFRRIAWPSYISMYMIENAVNLFNGLIDKISPVFKKLLSSQLRNVYAKLEQASSYTWFLEAESTEESIVESFALGFTSSVQELADNTKFLKERTEIINDNLEVILETDDTET